MSTPRHSRRSAILGLAALSLASLPAAAATAASDPLVGLYRRFMEARAHANTRGLDAEQFEAAMDLMNDLQDKELGMPPTTVEGAIAGLEWARLDQTEFGPEEDDLVLAMIDGALDVLRRLPNV